MLNIIIELSKYLLLVLILLYTFESFTVFRYEDDYDKRYILRKQLLLIIFIDFTAFLVIFLKKEESALPCSKNKNTPPGFKTL